MVETENTATATATATTTTKKKMPLSLNERHSRLLIDLSASHSKQPPPPPPSSSRFTYRGGAEAAKLKAAVDSSDEIPKFEGILEFDSPIGEANTVKSKAAVDSGEEIPKFSGIADFDSPIGEETVMQSKDVVYNDEVPRFSGIVDFDSMIDKEEEEEKAGKVKIKGRRRLCKASSSMGDERKAEEEIVGIADFSSPMVRKVVDVDDEDGGSDIRSILNDLSSRLEILSIEKTRNPRNVVDKSVVSVDDSLGEVRSEVIDSIDSDRGNRFGVGNGANIWDVKAETLCESEGESNEFDGKLSKNLGKGRNESRGNQFGVGNGANLWETNAATLSESKCENFTAFDGNSRKNFEKGKNESRNVGKKHVVPDENASLVSGKSARERRKHDDKLNDKYEQLSRVEILSDDDSDDESGEKILGKMLGKGKNESRIVGKKHVVSGKNASLVSGKSARERTKRNDKLNDKYEQLSRADILSGDECDEVVLDDEHAITLSGPTSTYKLSSKIGKMLFPHQRDGLRWLWSLYCQGKSGILGDDMGLGKTMQICGFLAGMFHSRLIKRVIVVAPKTLIPHWIKELSVVGLSEKTREYFGTCPKVRQYELQYVLQDKGVLLTTYDILRNNTKHLSRSYSVKEDEDEDDPIWDYMILDEGHLIKNPSTQRAKSLLEIPCSYRILISGTPLQNNLKELWALFNFCCPDLLGDKKEFKEKYEYPILRGNEKKASDREKRIGSNVAQELRERIRPYFLRRMKDEVFGEQNEENRGKLSKKNEIIVWLRLTTCQRHLYEAFLRSEIVLSAFDGSPLAALTILKKICDHPSLLTKRAAEDVLEGMDSMLNQEDLGLAEKFAMHVADISEADDLLESHGSVSCKISFILSLLQNLVPEEHNVLIFSQTRKMLNIIQDSLLSSGFSFQRIDGTTKAPDRLKIVDDFQEGRGAPIFLLTTQVGGLGLTLTNADRVIVVDPAWNPSSDNQSVDRAYRIGQTKDVIVYRLMTCGTIEEKIYRKQIFKGGLFRTATEHKEQTRYFSQQDLRELFSLPKDGFDVSPTQRQLHEEHSNQITLSDSLKAHVEFLESLGIGGVSHHSLLYSKTETVPPMPEEEDAARSATRSARYWNSSSLPECSVDGAAYAFNPKDVQLGKNKSSPQSSSQCTESEIKERIGRLSQLLSNKATVSRLPDGGARIQKQIWELNSMLKTVTTKTNEVIDLDDIADELQRSLRV